MDFEEKKYRKILELIVAGVVLYWSLNHLELIGGVLGKGFALLLPFILGACIAFVLNTPMRFVEKCLYRLAGKKGEKFMKKAGRGLSIALTLVLILGVIGLFSRLVLTEVTRTFVELIANIRAFFERTNLDTELPIPQELRNFLENPSLNAEELGRKLGQYILTGAGSMVATTIGVASSVVGGVVNLFLGLIFSIYVLSQKEKLGKQTRKLLYAVLPQKWASKLVEVGSLSYKTFSNFLSGQCMEAVILGCIFFAAMSIFRFPYAMLISVTIAFLALIPIFGAFIGCALGMFFIVIVDPVKCIWFLVMFLVIQQLEGNLIYPKVVGNSVGLPSIWVLVAVTLGGNLMGVVGMLIFIPLVSVIYVLLGRWVNRRLTEKKLKVK